MPFDIEAARQDGVAEEEIVDYLSSKVKFDTRAALEDGYSPTDIADHLANKYNTKSTNSLEKVHSFVDKTAEEVAKAEKGEGNQLLSNLIMDLKKTGGVYDALETIAVKGYELHKRIREDPLKELKRLPYDVAKTGLDLVANVTDLTIKAAAKNLILNDRLLYDYAKRQTGIQDEEQLVEEINQLPILTALTNLLPESSFSEIANSGAAMPFAIMLGIGNEVVDVVADSNQNPGANRRLKEVYELSLALGASHSAKAMAKGVVKGTGLVGEFRDHATYDKAFARAIADSFKDKSENKGINEVVDSGITDIATGNPRRGLYKITNALVADSKLAEDVLTKASEMIKKKVEADPLSELKAAFEKAKVENPKDVESLTAIQKQIDEATGVGKKAKEAEQSAKDIALQSALNTLTEAEQRLLSSTQESKAKKELEARFRNTLTETGEQLSLEDARGAISGRGTKYNKKEVSKQLEEVSKSTLEEVGQQNLFESESSIRDYAKKNANKEGVFGKKKVEESSLNELRDALIRDKLEQPLVIAEAYLNKNRAADAMAELGKLQTNLTDLKALGFDVKASEARVKELIDSIPKETQGKLPVDTNFKEKNPLELNEENSPEVKKIAEKNPTLPGMKEIVKLDQKLAKLNSKLLEKGKLSGREAVRREDLKAKMKELIEAEEAKPVVEKILKDEEITPEIVKEEVRTPVEDKWAPLREEAKSLGIKISGLKPDEIQAKINEVKAERKAKEEKTKEVKEAKKEEITPAQTLSIHSWYRNKLKEAFPGMEEAQIRSKASKLVKELSQAGRKRLLADLEKSKSSKDEEVVIQTDKSLEELAEKELSKLDEYEQQQEIVSLARDEKLLDESELDNVSLENRDIKSDPEATLSLKTARNGAELRSYLEEFGNTEQKVFANILKRMKADNFLSKVKIDIVDRNIASFVLGDNIKGIPDTITLSTKGTFNDVAHEMLHAITAREYSTNPEFAKKIDDLRNEAFDRLSKEQKAFIQELKMRTIQIGVNKRVGEVFKEAYLSMTKEGKAPLTLEAAYGFLNSHEFLSQAFSNREFQSLLKDMKIKEGGKFTSGFRLFIDSLAKVLGFEGREVVSNMLEKVIDVSGSELKRIVQSKDWTQPSLGEELGNLREKKSYRISEEVYKEAIKSLENELKKLGLNIGVPLTPTMIKEFSKVMYYHAERIPNYLKDFKVYSAKMLEEFGDGIKPHLKSLWDNFQDMMVGKDVFATQTLKHFEDYWPNKEMSKNEALKLIGQWEKKNSVNLDDVPGLKEGLKDGMSKQDVVRLVKDSQVRFEVKELSGLSDEGRYIKQKIEEINRLSDEEVTAWLEETDSTSSSATTPEARRKLLIELETDSEYVAELLSESDFSKEANQPLYGPDRNPSINLPGGKNYRERVFRTQQEVKLVAYDKHIVAKELYGENYSALGESQQLDVDQELAHLAQQAKMKELAQFDSHFPDVPNAIGWERVDERRVIDSTKEKVTAAEKRGYGTKIKFIDELQESDWVKNARESDKVNAEFGEGSDRTGTLRHPLLSQTKQLILKDSIRDAVERGMEGLGWNTGEEIGRRYNISDKINSVSVSRDYKDNIEFIARNKANKEVVNTTIREAELENWLGKNLADKLLIELKNPENNNIATMSGFDIATGIVWPFELYDKMIPRIIKELSDKNGWGLEIKDVKDSAGNLIHYTEFTPKLKADIAISTLPTKGMKVIKPFEPTPLGMLKNGKFENVRKPESYEDWKAGMLNRLTEVKEETPFLKEEGDRVEQLLKRDYNTLSDLEKKEVNDLMTPDEFLNVRGVDKEDARDLEGIITDGQGLLYLHAGVPFTPEIKTALLKMGQKLYNEGSKSFEDWNKKLLDIVQPIVPNIALNQKELKDVYSRLEKSTDVAKAIKANYASDVKSYGSDKIVDYSTDKKVPITEAEDNMLRQTEGKREPKFAFMDVANQVFRSVDRALESKFYDTIFTPFNEAKTKAKKEYDGIVNEVTSLIKENSLKEKDIRDVTKFAYAEQKEGRRTLELMKEEIPNKLNDRQKALYDKLLEKNKWLFNRLNEVRVAIGEKPLKEVENYFTFGRVIDQASFSGVNLLSLGEHDFRRQYETAFKYDIARVKSELALELNGFNVFNRYLKSSLDYIHKTPVITNSRGLIDYEWKTYTGEFKKDKEGNLRSDKSGSPIPVFTKNSLQGTAPKVYDYLTKYLNDEAGVRLEFQLLNSGTLYKGVMGLRNNVITATLGLNLGIVLKQFEAGITTSVETGALNVARSLARYVKSVKSGKDLATELSSILSIRSHNDISIADAIAARMLRETKEGIRGKIDVVRDLSLKGIEVTDAISAKITWYAAFEKAQRAKLPLRDAVKYADETVLKMQGSAERGHVAAVQKDAWGRIFTTFNTFNINRFSYLINDLIKPFGQEGNRVKALGKALRFIITMTAINSFYNNVLGMSSPGPSPIQSAIEADEGKKLQAFVGEAAGTIPIVGGSLRYPGSQLGPVVSYVGDATSVGYKSLGKKKLTLADYIKLGEMTGKAAGVPGTSQAVGMLRKAPIGTRDALSSIGIDVPVSKQMRKEGRKYSTLQMFTGGSNRETGLLGKMTGE